MIPHCKWGRLTITDSELMQGRMRQIYDADTQTDQDHLLDRGAEFETLESPGVEGAHGITLTVLFGLLVFFLLEKMVLWRRECSTPRRGR